MKLRALSQIDIYEGGHKYQYPKDVTEIYMNMTPRSGKHSKNSKGIWYIGVNLVIQDILDLWKDTFFSQPMEEVVDRFTKTINRATGQNLTYDHIRSLHKLQFLPVVIKTLPEGSFVPYKIPVMTMRNTLPEYAWLPGYLQTLILSDSWHMINTATSYMRLRTLSEMFAESTCDNKDHVPYQFHDFSFRSLPSKEVAAKSGFAALACGSKGTDILSSLDIIEDYYGETPEGIGSIAATEHSVMCAGGKDTEFDTYKRLLTEVYPDQNVSIVSDTWNIYRVMEDYLVKLKDTILSKEGRTIIRHDSGDPLKELCGHGSIIDILDSEDEHDALDQASEVYVDTFTVENLAHFNSYSSGLFRSKSYVTRQFHYRFKGIVYSCQIKMYAKRSDESTYISGYEVQRPTPTTASEIIGVIPTLWNIFGGTTNSKGYKVLNPKIGVLFGDSITHDIALDIFKRLQDMGFASSNVVFGIGGFEYQYQSTRDTHGFAIKATSMIKNKARVSLEKDPITDSGVKKSARGLLQVTRTGPLFNIVERVTPKQENRGCLKILYKDGYLKKTTFTDVRKVVEETYGALKSQPLLKNLVDYLLLKESKRSMLKQCGLLDEVLMETPDIPEPAIPSTPEAGSDSLLDHTFSFDPN